MKQLLLLITLFVFTTGFAAQYQSKTMVFEDSTRRYLLYVPNIYDGSKPVPVVIALHGLGDNMNNFKGIGFDAIADTANFIVIVPQALVDNVLTGSTAWNSGAGTFGITLNPNINDLGFINALIDSTSANYNVDQTRVYATGFSMGGFMTNRLGIELSNRIAAIASVSGTKGTYVTTTPTRKIPAAHFHGTADQTVSYGANTFGSNAEDLVNYWVTNNNTNTTPVIDSLPNTTNDGRTVIHYHYGNGDYNTEVEFYKVIGGTHEWLFTPNNDMDYTTTIWEFFSRHKWEAQTATAINDVEEGTGFNLYPNPANDFVVLQNNLPAGSIAQIEVMDATGKKVFATQSTSSQLVLNTAGLSNGLYLVRSTSAGNATTRRLVISR